jgi:hypothetical protein
MKNILLTAAALAALLAPAATRAGSFYGLWWDGSAEKFVSVDPYAGTSTVISGIPDVKWIRLESYAFDPDSSRYAFVGRETGPNWYYYVIDAPSGATIARIAKNDTISSMVYSPNEQKAYGLSWTPAPAAPADTTVTLDSLGNPVYHITPPSWAIPYPAGQEYFVSLDVNTGARVNTQIPGVRMVQMASQVLNPDSGRYVFSGRDSTGSSYYYVIETATGNLLARYPQTHKIDNPVYNPSNGAIHGLWWSDSSYYIPPVSGPDSASSPGPGHHVLAGTEYFITLRPDSTISMTAIPGVKYISISFSAFDSDSGRYVFRGSETGNVNKYYVVDALTGNVISQATADRKIDNLVFAPAHSTVDTTHGPVRVAARGFRESATHVKAFNGFLTLDVANAAGQSVSFSLRDVSGKTLVRQDGIRDGRARIETRGLKAGIHLYQIRSGRSVLGQGKILIR